MSDEPGVGPIPTPDPPIDAPPRTTWSRALKQRWTPGTFSDRVQLAGLILTVIGLIVAIFTVSGLTKQLRVNDHTNRVAIRGQLYQTENALLGEEGSDNKETFATLWSEFPPEVQGRAYARSLLGLITADSAALTASSAEALHRAIYAPHALRDEARRTQTAELRRLFLFVVSNLYHMHNAFDYSKDGILRPGEWATWKGIIGEMNAHPVLLAVIWHGYQNRYLSRDFGDFLQEEICGRAARSRPTGVRNCEFARAYYPDMFEPGWSDALPNY